MHPGAAGPAEKECLLILDVVDPDQVVPELGPDGADDLALLRCERSPLELGDHLALAEPAQVAAVTARGAGRVFLRERAEVLARIDAGLERLRLLFGLD